MLLRPNQRGLPGKALRQIRKRSAPFPAILCIQKVPSATGRRLASVAARRGAPAGDDVCVARARAGQAPVTRADNGYCTAGYSPAATANVSPAARERHAVASIASRATEDGRTVTASGSRAAGDGPEAASTGSRAAGDRRTVAASGSRAAAAAPAVASLGSRWKLGRITRQLWD